MAPPRRRFFTLATAACGLLAPACALGGIALAIALAPRFDWFRENFSDLGVGRTAAFFNGGMVLGGLLGLGFAAAFRDRATTAGRAGALLLALAFACLALVGVFTVHQRLEHGAVAFGFFVAAPVAVMLLGHDARAQGKETWGRRSVQVGAAALLGFFLLAGLLVGMGGKYAIAELYHAVLLSAWAVPAALRQARGGGSALGAGAQR